jgi:hypothetical protein
MTENGGTVILDPTDERVLIERALAPRPARLTGTVGLIDISKPRGDVFLDRLAESLRERLPELAVRRYRKPTFTKRAPDDLIRTIATECDVVIEGLAD